MKKPRLVRVLLGLALLAPLAVAAPPRRIVSTAPAFTEILFAIGAGDRVVAVSDYCRYPEEARRRPRVGGPLNLSYETLLRLEPDLVVLPASLEGPLRRCRRLGLPVLALPNDRVDDVLASIVRLGEVTGRIEAAGALAAAIRRRLDAAAEATRARPRVRALLVVFRAAGGLQDLTVASRGTFLDELLRRAGGTNVIGETTPDYPRVSKEAIVALDPEVIFDLTFTTDPETTLRAWDALPSLTAVRTGRVVPMPDPAATIPGPRMTETLERFLAVLHPDLAAGAATSRER